MSAPSFLIRVAQPADASALAALARRTFRDAFAHTVSEENMTRYLASAFALEQVASEIANSETLFLVAEADDTMLGYVKLYFGEPLPQVQGAKPVKLWRLYTLATNQSAGVGRSLVAASIPHVTARGGQTLWLTVNQENHRAISFYQRDGFRITGETTFKLGDETHHDFLMEKPLTA